MKRRDFLKSIAAFFASLAFVQMPDSSGIPSLSDWHETSEADVQTEALEVERVRHEWPEDFWSSPCIGSISTIKACDDMYVCACSDDVFLESFDGGITWREVDDNANTT